MSGHLPMRAVSVLVTMTLVLSAIGQLMPAASGAEDGEVAITPADLAPELAEWTFLVYLDADNNLEGAGVEDLNEMETVGSTDEVNIIVQMDRAVDYDTSNGDWEDTRRYYVTQDDDPSAIGSTLLQEMGEANMGDPGTLVDFVLWGAENFPARKYLVDLWDHGGAFYGACWDDTVEDEEIEEDWLSLPDIQWALQTIHTRLEEPVDILGFDACLMAQAAVLYEVRHHTDYIVASGYSEPGEGWPYEGILPPLVNKPGMGPVELGRIIVDEYIDSYTDREEDPQDNLAVTQALFDSDKVDELAVALDRMGMLLSTRAGDKVGDAEDVLLGKNQQITQARRFTNSYDLVSGYLPANVIAADPSGYALYDIMDLMGNLKQYIPADRELHQLADEVIAAAEDVIVFARANEYHGDFKGANGLSVYFPSGNDWDNTYSERYDETAFAMECHWDEFLLHYFNKENAPDTAPGITVDGPVPGEVIGGLSYTVSGKAYDLQDTPRVEVRVGGGDWVEADTKSIGGGQVRWEYQWDISDSDAGNTTVSARALDGDGRMSPIVSREVDLEPAMEPPEKNMAFVAAVGGVFLALVIMFMMVKSWRRKSELERDKGSADGG